MHMLWIQLQYLKRVPLFAIDILNTAAAGLVGGAATTEAVQVLFLAIGYA
jgi:hypothetical protein